MSYQLLEAQMAAKRGNIELASDLEEGYQNFLANFANFAEEGRAATLQLEQLCAEFRAEQEFHQPMDISGEKMTP